MIVAKAVLILSVLSCVLTFPFHGRIYGGDTAKPGQFPFIASLNLNISGVILPYCSASVIHPQWLVTAAHCLITFPPDLFYILADTTSLSSGGTTFPIISTVFHPDFNQLNGYNDIVLIKIEGDLTLTNITKPIKIDDAKANETCTVMGWGSTENGNTDDLQFANLSALSDEDCTRLAQGGDYVLDRCPGQICALASEGIAPCYGDSGGPLVCHEKLVGVVSYNISPCAKGYPDVYTRVFYYQSWINDVITSH